MGEFQKTIDALKAEYEELLEIRQKISIEKSDITINTVGELLKKVDESVNELLEATLKDKKEYFDKDLGDTIKKSIAEAIAAISKIKAPEVKVTPNINVDLKPLQSIAENISIQNKALIELVGKISSGNNSEELQRLIVALIGKQSNFLDKGLANYSETLIKISDGVNKKAEKLTFKRDRDNLIDGEVIIVYKK